MEQLVQVQTALEFVVDKKLTIVLDRIAEDYKLDRESLNKYLDREGPATKQLSITTTICVGKTKKGDACTNKTKPGSMFCGKHLP